MTPHHTTHTLLSTPTRCGSLVLYFIINNKVCECVKFKNNNTTNNFYNTIDLQRSALVPCAS